MTAYREEPGVASCAICLTQQSLEEAYLDGCFHRFCLACIDRWTDSQRDHPPADGAHAFVCPLCKTPYASVLHDYQQSSYKRKWAARQGAGVGSLPDGAAVDLTPLQRRRRASYFSPHRTQTGSGNGSRAAVLTAAHATRPDVALWLRRELEALMLDGDVGMVVAHMSGTLRTATGGVPTQRRGAASTAGASREAVVRALHAAGQPYVFEHAGRLGEELFDFAASGRSIGAHDLATGMAGGASKPAASAAATAVATEEDGSRESGELSPEQSSGSWHSTGGAGGATTAGVELSTAADISTAAQPANQADLGSRKLRTPSPSPERGSDCLSLSLGSEFGDSDSEAYLPLVQASAAAQRRKLEAAAADYGPKPEEAGSGGADASPTGGPASSPPRSKRHRSHLEAASREQRHQRGDAAVSSRRRPGADASGIGAAHASRSGHRHKRQRQHASEQHPRAAVVAPAAAAKPAAVDAAAAAAAAAERLRCRAEKFGMPLPPPMQPPIAQQIPAEAAPAGSKAAAITGSSHRHGTPISGRSALRNGSSSGRGSIQQNGSSPRRRQNSRFAREPGQLRPFVDVRAAPAQPAVIESPTLGRPVQPQGGREATGKPGLGQQHRKRRRRQGDSPDRSPISSPAADHGNSAPRAIGGSDLGSGAAGSASDSTKRSRNRVPGGDSGGGLRMFRNALIAEPASGGARANGIQGTTGSSGKGSGSGASALELLRLQALAAHAASKP